MHRIRYEKQERSEPRNHGIVYDESRESEIHRVSCQAICVRYAISRFGIVIFVAKFFFYQL